MHEHGDTRHLRRGPFDDRFPCADVVSSFRWLDQVASVFRAGRRNASASVSYVQTVTSGIRTARGKF